MKARLIEILESTGYEAYEQGSLTDTNEYPDGFFTYWNDDTESIDHYDNKEHATTWYFTVDFYSINPLIATAMILKVKELLKVSGWIVNGKGRDTYSDSKRHSGRTIETIYIEKEEIQNV